MPIDEYLSTKVVQTKIKATNETIKQIVKAELDRLGHDADLNHIDVSEVTDMNNLFNCEYDDLGSTYKDLNPDISKWNVSNVKNMTAMFWKCENFNQDLSRWDVRNVETMNAMFYKCENFNQDLSSWNVKSVTGIYKIFHNCPIKEEFKPKFNK